MARPGLLSEHERRLAAGPRPNPAVQHKALVAVVLIAALALAAPSAFAMWTTISGAISPPPLPITYEQNPIPFEDPAARGHPLDGSEVLHVRPGDVVSLLPVRCVTDDGDTGTGRLPFIYSHRLVSVQTGVPTDLPGGVIAADVGCQQVRSDVNVVPPGTSPGLYYFDGTATAIGKRRAGTVAWRTPIFEVVP